MTPTGMNPRTPRWTGPLTQQDMLSLTNLGAVFRNITNLQGLEAAQNLVSLDLQDNRITSVNILTNLTRLVSRWWFSKRSRVEAGALGAIL